MLVLAIGGVLVGFAFLVISFVTENSTWAWGCIAACAAAAMILFLDARSRRSSRPTASSDAVGASVQRVDPIAEGGGPMEAGASAVGTTTAVPALGFRTGQPTALGTDSPALEQSSVEPDPLEQSSVEPDPVAAVREPHRSPEPMVVSAAVPVPESAPEPSSEIAPAPDVSGPVLAEAPVPPVANGFEHDEQDAPVAVAAPVAAVPAAAAAAPAAPVVAGLEHDVLVVDEHPFFHLPDCTWLVGRETMSLPGREAVELGFTPCTRCSPDRTVASPARA